MTKVISRDGARERLEVFDSPFRREIFSARTATLIAIAAILLLIGLACHSQRDQIETRERERAENQARAFEFHVHHEIQNVDDLLRQLRKRQLNTEQGFQRAVEELRAGELGGRSIQFGFVDIDGYLRYTTAGAESAGKVFLGDREYFKAHLTPGIDRLFISRPLIGALAEKGITQFSRGYFDAGKRLIGVVMISMPSSLLTDGATALGLRPDDVATILRQDGYLLSRTPVMPELAKLAERFPADFLKNFEIRHQDVFEQMSPIDGVRRLIAYRQNLEFPVISIVAPTTRYRDIELRQTAWRHIGLAAVVVALLLSYHLFHERSIRHTATLRRERELERHHLAEAQAIANLGSWQLDVGDRKLYWSDEVYRIFGLPAGGNTLTYDDFLSHVHPDDRLALDAAFGRAREEGVPYSLRHRIVRPDGSVRHVIQRGQLVFDCRGMVDQFTGTVQDVTEALDAEVRLLEAARSDRLARAVFDGVMQPMIVLSAEGRLLDVNPAFEETFELSGLALCGRLLSEIENTPAGAQAFANRPSLLFQPDRSASEWEGDIALSLAGVGNRVLSLCLSGIRDASGRIEHYVGIYTDVTQRKRREDDAVHSARHDPLTGLPNRQYAMERLARSLNRAARKQTEGVLIFVDLDYFKAINDTHGHDAGDEVLRVIARRFRAAVRQEDMVARLGGDEFIALIEEIGTMEVVRRVAESIRAAAAEPIAYAGDQLLNVSASIGIAVFPRAEETVEELLARADQAMYGAKRDGRDLIRFGLEPVQDHT